MSTVNLEEIYRRYEFNKTEPETLVGLIESVIEKSDIIKSNFRRYREIVKTVYEVLMRENFIHTIELSQSDEHYKKFCGVGIDGSFQYVGGMGGIWYLPISCSQVRFEKGLWSEPTVSVAAGIHDINQLEYMNVAKEAEFRMLIGETKAINQAATKIDRTRKTVIFIDGPIVDPPWVGAEKRHHQYVKDRCEAIKLCIDKKALLIGCVKRIKGSYLINHIIDKLAKSDVEKNRAKQFISDMHLITYIFTRFAFEENKGVFYTSPIDISEADPAHKLYYKEGIKVCSVLMQKDHSSRPIRLDIPFRSEKSEDGRSRAVDAVKTTALWSYPGQDIPLPVMLAHEKCNVRRGCAEVLYAEMITRTTTHDLFDNIVKIKLG